MSPRDYDKEAALPRFSLDRRITVLMLALTLAVVGTVATLGIPAEMLPRGFVGNWMFVYVPWQDAPPRETLEKLAIPLEEELATVRGINQMFSISFNGGARVVMQFKQGTEMSVAYREVRDRVQRARVDFPSDVDEVYIRKDDASGFPVYAIGVAVDPELENAYDLIQTEIITRLERLDGVASVNVFGLEEKEILIELNREKTNAAGLNIYQLANQLGDDNFTMASGTVQSGPRKLLLRSVASYRSIEELRERRISSSARLKDVASISYDEPDKTYRARVNSMPAVALHVIKESEANTKELCDRLDEEYARLEANPRLSGLWMKNFFSQGEVIGESLETLVRSGMIGGVIAGMVLFFFMRRFRLTVIVALSIPLSLIIGLTVMYFAGETLNLLTLIGLMMCIGLLVDNSVVVAENIHRLHREGLGRRDACIRGAGEVGLAITMSTLTTIVVFLPAALVSGPAQFFLVRLALPVAVSVAGSLIVALVFIPLCVYLTLPTRAVAPTEPGRWQRLHDRTTSMLRILYERTFGWLNQTYNRLLARCLERRLALVLGVIVAFALSYQVFEATTEFVGQQEDEQAQFEIDFELPANTTLEEAEQYFREVERVVESKQEELGLDGWFVFHRKTGGEMQGWFAPERKSKVTAKQAMELIVEEIPEKPGVEIFTGTEQQATDDAVNTHVVFVKGEDPDLVNSVTEQLADLLVQIDGVVGRRKAGAEAPNQLGLVVDRDKAQHLGVNPQIIAGVVGYALRGQALPKFQADGREVPVRVRFREQDRESLTELADFQVPTQDGQLLPLSAITRTEVLPTVPYIVRRNKIVGQSITLELESGKEEETRRRLNVLQAGIDLPEGISFGPNFQRQQLDDDLAGIKFAVPLSIIFIYLLMGFLFESFALPLSILFTIPLSMIGVWWGHIVTGRDMDFLGAVAVILLIGVVVNNGIVLIDYVNRLRSQGKARNEAVLTATHLRFRPIMMTAITTIGGMVPLALAGASSIGISYTSFSLTLIGGLTTATLLTLLVVPVFYVLIDDARTAASLAVSRVLSRDEVAA